MKSFRTILAGNTLGAHQAFIKKLKAIGQREVTSEFDYYLVFCPIVSRVGTDISEAMGKIPGDAQVILVVMHHTINADSFVGDSSRHATRSDIVLTVDCLFHEGRLLDCKRNEKAFRDVQSVLGPPPKVPGELSFWDRIRSCWRNNFFTATLFLALSGCCVFYVVRHYVPYLYPPLVNCTFLW